MYIFLFSVKLFDFFVDYLVRIDIDFPVIKLLARVTFNYISNVQDIWVPEFPFYLCTMISFFIDGTTNFPMFPGSDGLKVTPS